MKLQIKCLICLIILALFGGMVYGQFAKPSDATAYRKAVMRVLGTHFGRIGAVVKGEIAYNAEAVAHDASIVADMAELPWEACLVQGSYDSDTTLKSDVLKEKDKFMEIAGTLSRESRKLEESAKPGQLDAVKTQFGVVAQNCKACHSRYRK